MTTRLCVGSDELQIDLRFEHRCVDDRPEMDEPAEQHDPEHTREHEHDDRHQQPTLNELPEPRDEEAAQCSDDVAGRSLSCHGETLQRFPVADKSFPQPVSGYEPDGEESRGAVFSSSVASAGLASPVRKLFTGGSTCRNVVP